MKLEDYGKVTKVTVQQWMERSGACKQALYTPEDLAKVLLSFRAYIYEAEFRPRVTINNAEEIPFDDET